MSLIKSQLRTFLTTKTCRYPFLLLLFITINDPNSCSCETIGEKLADFSERVQLIREESKTLSSTFVDLSFDAPNIVRDSAVRVGSILEKHFQKLKQNCEELELMANKAKTVSKHHPVEFFPAKRLLDFNLSLIYSRRLDLKLK